MHQNHENDWFPSLTKERGLQPAKAENLCLEQYDSFWRIKRIPIKKIFCMSHHYIIFMLKNLISYDAASEKLFPIRA